MQKKPVSVQKTTPSILFTYLLTCNEMFGVFFFALHGHRYNFFVVNNLKKYYAAFPLTIRLDSDLFRSCCGPSYSMQRQRCRNHLWCLKGSINYLINNKFIYK